MQQSENLWYVCPVLVGRGKDFSEFNLDRYPDAVGVQYLPVKWEKQYFHPASFWSNHARGACYQNCCQARNKNSLVSAVVVGILSVSLLPDPCYAASV